MASPFSAGDDVQTPLGKGVVREVRTSGRLLVDIGGRKVLIEGGAARPIQPSKSTRKKRAPAPPAVDHLDAVPGRHRPAAEIDLHGLTVDEALDRAIAAINDTLLSGHARLRLIHGRSGGRIKAALHRHLRALPSVRGFGIDPANEGVTVVEF